MKTESYGKLYVVATPIGNLEDFSPRGQATLHNVSWIASEDTRHSAGLLKHYGMTTRCFALHAFNEKKQLTNMLEWLKEGQSGALISDAGTPLISDPGFHLIKACHDEGIEVVAVPGPCASIAAVSILAVQEGPFHFEGFLPAKSSGRMKRLSELKPLKSTLVFYEAPHRIEAMIEDCVAVLGETRIAGIARELTKKFESTYRGPLKSLLEKLKEGTLPQKGEFVVVIEGQAEQAASHIELEALMPKLLAFLPAAQAAKLASQLTQIDRKTCYAEALKHQNHHNN